MESFITFLVVAPLIVLLWGLTIFLLIRIIKDLRGE